MKRFFIQLWNALQRIVYYGVDLIMPARWYIRHIGYADRLSVVEDYRYFFGPFKKHEAEDRVDDEYAELLRYGGDSVQVVRMTWLAIRQEDFITPKSVWDEHAENLIDDEPAAWQEEN